MSWGIALICSSILNYKLTILPSRVWKALLVKHPQWILSLGQVTEQTRLCLQNWKSSSRQIECHVIWAVALYWWNQVLILIPWQRSCSWKKFPNHTDVAISCYCNCHYHIQEVRKFWEATPNYDMFIVKRFNMQFLGIMFTSVSHILFVYWTAKLNMSFFWHNQESWEVGI